MKKAKILVSIFSLTLVVVGFFFATTSILAAANQNVGSPFSVSYSAPNGVDADVTASYYTASNNVAYYTSQYSTASLTLSRGSDSGSLTADSSPTFSVINYYVIFEFGFYNKSLVGRSITVTMNNDSTITGSLTVSYGKSSNRLVIDSTAVTNEEKETMIACAKNTSGTTGYTLGDAVELAPANHLYIYMMVEVSEGGGFNANASYVSTAAHGVSFELSKVNPT